MYQNVGQKIKNLTKVVVIIMMVLSVIGGISMMALDEEMIFPGLLIAGIGCFAAWISGLTMYAYGDIADNIQSINQQLANMNGGAPAAKPNYQYAQPAYQAPAPQAPTYTYAPQPEAAPVTEERWFCTQCGAANGANNSFCVSCGKAKS